MFGIELLEDGKVYDPLYDMTFETVANWASYSVEQDTVEYEETYKHVNTEEE